MADAFIQSNVQGEDTNNYNSVSVKSELLQTKSRDKSQFINLADYDI